MTREEAIRILASSCIPGSKQTEALETLIPELAESEDERIIKLIRSLLENARNVQSNTSLYKQYDDALAWLEKQKEQKPISFNEPYTPDDYEVVMGENTTSLKKKEQKHTLKFKVGDKVHLEGDEINILTITGIEEDRYLTDCAYGPILFGAEDIWQIVEQKPAESISQLTVQGKGVYKICPRCKERMVRDDSMVYTSMPPQYRYECPKCGESECDTVMYDNPEMEEQKPNSTEDMPYITDEHFYEREPADSFKYKLAEYMTRCCTKKEGPYGYEYGISAESILKMAEEELLKRGVVQKPAEWSEEDEHMRNALWNLIQLHYAQDNVPTLVGILSGEFKSWLKSLKSQYHGDVTMTEAYKMGKEAGMAEMAKSMPLPEDTVLFNKGVAEGRRLEREDMWKPTKEQMNSLLNAEGKIRELRFIAIASSLADLYEDLRKLREGKK